MLLPPFSLSYPLTLFSVPSLPIHLPTSVHVLMAVLYSSPLLVFSLLSLSLVSSLH